MSETADYNPGCWSGHDFSSARDVYDEHVGRSYGDAKSSAKVLKDLLPKNIKTLSRSPLVILFDVTGSMGSWPATMFSKVPYLELEGKEYLGKDMEICWGAIGDHFCDDYSLQMRPFAEGLELKDRLAELIIEGGGGGGKRESYELGALYCARNIEMPNAINPICIIIGDEGFYDTINKGDADTYANVTIEKRIKSSDVFSELKRKFATYLVRKPYNIYCGDELSSDDKSINKQWEGVLGSDHILMLPNADRIVDVIFGILANETDRVEYFKDEITDRQEPEQVETVMKSLETIHRISSNDAKLLRSGKSVMHNIIHGKKTKSLL